MTVVQLAVGVDADIELVAHGFADRRQFARSFAHSVGRD